MDGMISNLQYTYKEKSLHWVVGNSSVCLDKLLQFCAPLHALDFPERQQHDRLDFAGHGGVVQ